MNNKLETLTNLFEGKEIRSIWNSEEEEYYFSVVDVIEVLTNSSNPRNYWNMLKIRLKNEEGSELYTNCVQLKMKSLKDGKMYKTDTLDTAGIFRLIESIPSKKAEPFKIWLANLGKERVDEVFDPEIAINRALEYYRKRGYTEEWIEKRLKGIQHRKKLTDIWKEGGITKDYEFGILTNEIYQSWSGMKAQQYKEFKNIRKENLRDNMTDIEVALADLGEITTRDIAANEHPKGLEENIKIAKLGGTVAKDARNSYEKVTKKSALSNNNNLDYKYIKSIENK